MTAGHPVDRGPGAEQDHLVWIFGSSRSGSTWLLRMLTDLDGVVGIDDPHLGHHLGVWRPLPLAWMAAAEPPSLTTLDELKRDKPSYFFSEQYRDAWAPALRELISARFEAQRRDLAGSNGDLSPSTLIVKEPGSQAAGLLLSLFPESKLVFLLRDGRDVVDSWMDAYRDGSWAVEEGAFPVARWGRLGLIRWLASVWLYRTHVVEEAFARHDPERRVAVRYEDLLSDPERALASICESLDIPSTPSRIAAAARRHAYERIPVSERGSLRAVRSARPGGWRDNLSATERAALEQVLAQKLIELGYSVASSAGDAAAGPGELESVA
jgi:hypothetical protein